MRSTFVSIVTSSLALASALLLSSSAFAAEPAVTNAAAPVAAPRAPGPVADNKGISLGLPAGGGPTLGLSYNLTDDTSLRLDFGLDLSIRKPTSSSTSGLGASASADASSKAYWGFSIDAGYRMYLWHADSLHAFVQPGIFFSKRAEDGSFGTLATIAATGSVGAEYFFSKQLSVSGATGLSLAVSNDFSDVQLRTGTTALYGNFYW